MASGSTSELKTTVVVDAKAGTRDLDAFIKKLDGLEGEEATVVLALKAAQAQQDLEAILLDISKLDAESVEIPVKLEQAAAAKADLEQLESAIKEVNGTPVEIDTKGAVKGFQAIEKSADSSRSVTANMVGNATQDLGQLGGVAGSAGVALGQMGEYMADARASGEGFGSILKNFGAQALPIAAIGIGVQLITSELEKAKKIKAFRADEVDAFAKSIRAAGDATDNLVESLQDAQKIEALDVLGGGVRDMTAQLAKAGITAQEWAEAISTGDDGLKSLGQQLEATNLSGQEQARIFLAAKSASEDYGAAQGKAAEQNRVYGSDTTEAKKAAEELADTQMNAAIEAARADAEETTKNAEAHRDAANAILEQVSAARGAADASFALRDAQQSYREEVAALPDKLKEAKGDLGLIRAALDDVAESAGNVADATVRQADEQAKARGETLDATAALDSWNASMLTQASTLKGPARDAILTYVAEVNGIPPEKMTDVSALLDTGSVDTAKTALDNASVARKSTVTAVADTKQADKDLDAVADKERTAQIRAMVSAAISRAAGSLPFGVSTNAANANAAPPAPAAAAFGLSALATPMASEPSEVVSTGRTAFGGAPRSVTYNTVNVTVPRGYRELDAATAAHRLARRSGRLYAGRR